MDGLIVFTCFFTLKPLNSLKGDIRVVPYWTWQNHSLTNLSFNGCILYLQHCWRKQKQNIMITQSLWIFYTGRRPLCCDSQALKPLCRLFIVYLHNNKMDKTREASIKLLLSVTTATKVTRLTVITSVTGSDNIWKVWESRTIHYLILT